MSDTTALLADLVESGAALGWVQPPSHGARIQGIEQLTLDSRGDNTAAHALWRSRGFVEYGTLVDFVAVGEARYDKTFWVLDLRPHSPQLGASRPSP